MKKLLTALLLTLALAGNAAAFGSDSQQYFPAVTNLILQSADLSDAAWNPTGVTIPGGVADPFGGTTAHTMTATGAFGGIYQGIASTTGTFTNSMWVRRRTGTGIILLKPANNVNVPITVTSEWQRFSATSSVSSAIPYIGIAIVDIGDAIDIYGGQMETGSIMHRYSPTTTTTATLPAKRVPSGFGF